MVKIFVFISWLSATTLSMTIHIISTPSTHRYPLHKFPCSHHLHYSSLLLLPNFHLVRITSTKDDVSFGFKLSHPPLCPLGDPAAEYVSCSEMSIFTSKRCSLIFWCFWTIMLSVLSWSLQVTNANTLFCFCLPFLILYLQFLHRFVCSFRCYASVCSYITPTTVFTVRWAPGCRRSILDTASWCHPIPMYLVCLSNHGRIHLCYTGARS